MIKKFILILLLTSCATSPESTPDNCAHDAKTFRCVKFVDNYDGDTFTFEIPNTHPLLGHKAKIRLLGVDTPEIRTKDQCEKRAGMKAKALAHQKLSSANRIDLKNIQRGKYFRIVAEVIVDGQSLGPSLLANKLAYKYSGGTKKKIDWCSPSL